MVVVVYTLYSILYMVVGGTLKEKKNQLQLVDPTGN